MVFMKKTQAIVLNAVLPEMKTAPPPGAADAPSRKRQFVARAATEKRRMKPPPDIALQVLKTQRSNATEPPSLASSAPADDNEKQSSKLQFVRETDVDDAETAPPSEVD
jgi:hypothetical protein